MELETQMELDKIKLLNIQDKLSKALLLTEVVITSCLIEFARLFESSEEFSILI